MYKILKTFSDIHTGALYAPGMEVEFTKKRHTEITEKLGAEYLEPVRGSSQVFKPADNDEVES
jgi:hypothetical protein